MFHWLIRSVWLFHATHAWGNSGHKSSARVAFDSLNYQTRMYVKSVMGAASIEEFLVASTWADTLEDTDLGEYHFVHSTYQTCLPFEKGRDCGFNGSGRCLVSGIARYVEVLVSETTSPVDKRDASKMLIHLVADMHQPMHAGFADDFGGTTITLSHPKGLSLLEVWDYYLIEGELLHESHIAYSHQRKTQKSHLMGFWPLDTDISEIGTQIELWAASIVTEISTQYTCALAYFDGTYWLSTGAALSDAYMQSRS